jgi:ribosomal protein S8E
VEEVKRIDTAIAAKAEAIRSEFSEQKKYEVAREHANKRLAEEAQRRVQQRFDEIGAQQYQKAKGTPA